jgi:pimeloyl-ACP methyl ester carboxylesterase
LNPEEIGLEASGLRFAALAWGPPDGPPALCLHGYPDTAWTWRHLGPHLAQRGWRVIAPFMRGYAPTELAPDRCYQIGALAADAQNLHQALGSDLRTVLIGHDWGAVAAYCAAAQMPWLFASVVALAIPPPQAILDAPPSVLIRQARASWYMAFQQLPVISERSLHWLIPKLWADWSPGYDGAADAQRALAALDGPGRRTAALRYYRAAAQPWLRSRRYARQQERALSTPRQPVLYLHGADDGCGLPAYVQRSRELLAPGSRVELVPDAGHFLQLERPGVVNDLIAEFLGGDATP